MKGVLLAKRAFALFLSAGIRSRPSSIEHPGRTLTPYSVRKDDQQESWPSWTRPFTSGATVRAAAAKVYAEGQDSSELFDIYKPPPPEERDGLVTSIVPAGFSKARGKVHEDGDWHRAVHVWILDPDANSLLIQKRSEHKDTFPGRWDVSVGGHIEAGDTSIPTAIREIEEELGLTGVEGKLEHLGTVASSLRGSTKKGDFHCQELQDIYLLPVPGLDVSSIKFAVGEISEVRTVPVSVLEKEFDSGDPSYVPRPSHYRTVLFNRLRGS